MIDVVYILGTESNWQDNELRFSLRSIEKNLSAVRNVYIIGTLPDFINTDKVIHIPYEDKHLYKQTRIALKVLQACFVEPLSEEFLFLNDDHFLLELFQAGNFPYLYEENLLETASRRTENSMYGFSLRNTFEALLMNGFETNNFDIHCPIVYNKEKFKEMFNTYDFYNTPNSFVVKSLYCNTFGIKGEKREDIKINTPLSYEKIQEYCNNKALFSVSDLGLNQNMKNFLQNLFPIKSVYERD